MVKVMSSVIVYRAVECLRIGVYHDTKQGINWTCFLPQTPLHLAVLTHQARIARCLVVAGANVDVRDRRGNTALHLACQIGDLECVKALMEPITVAETNTANLHYDAVMQQLPQNLEERNYDGM
jgi:hypothetical protein